ncbi:MAG TPA: creatininase family protein [Thermomicrobiaceae bacterium]|nr:creatininase family protein [Thermomicrobiaceae bacterium]
MAKWRTVELGRMSWEEVAEVIPERPVILLPIGTVEQHGPHLPVNADNMVAHFVATRAAEQANALVAPGINYGCSAVFRRFPGTIPVRQETLAAVLRDVCESLIAQGFRRLVFVDNHGGNEGVCEQVARELKAAHGIVIGNIYPWNLGYSLMRDTYEDVASAYGHGAEPETSAMLAMFPDDVTRERMTAGRYQPFAGWQVQSYSKVDVPGQSVTGTVYLDSDEVAPTGVTGDQRETSAERGRVWIERVVGFAVDFIRHYDAVTADADWARIPADTGTVAPHRHFDR